MDLDNEDNNGYKARDPGIESIDRATFGPSHWQEIPEQDERVLTVDQQLAVQLDESHASQEKTDLLLSAQTEKANRKRLRSSSPGARPTGLSTPEEASCQSQITHSSTHLRKIKRARITDNSSGQGDSHARSECFACGQATSSKELIKVSCSHRFCKTCLAAYLKTALQPGATFPPQCCRLPITIDLLRLYMSPELSGKHTEK